MRQFRSFTCLVRLCDLAKARGCEYQIVAVDDQGEDEGGAALAAAADRMPIHVIRHRFSRGVGGLAKGSLNGARGIIFVPVLYLFIGLALPSRGDCAPASTSRFSSWS